MKPSIMDLATLVLAAATAIANAQTVRGRRVPPVVDPTTIHYMPAEEDYHEGTWLQWPHNYGWDKNHVKRYEESWVKMTEALHAGEKVHIICYNASEKTRINTLLGERNVNLAQVTFHVWKTDDVWVRDNGPIFTYDEYDELKVQDWKFNGWGNKADYALDDVIPKQVATYTKLPRIDVPMTNEGGSIEVDGNGTLMAKRSSILNNDRNRGLTQAGAEAYFRKYLGVENFIWLDGDKGGDITDDHIDGTARFAPGNTIVTYYRNDFLKPSEYDVLTKARNVNGQLYNIVSLPLTQMIVPGVNDYGIYINYYVGNDVVIIPTYNDPSDQVAINILKKVYRTRRMVGIDFVELYKDGGLAHCVTQQQPVAARRRQ